MNNGSPFLHNLLEPEDIRKKLGTEFDEKMKRTLEILFPNGI